MVKEVAAGGGSHTTDRTVEREGHQAFRWAIVITVIIDWVTGRVTQGGKACERDMGAGKKV